MPKKKIEDYPEKLIQWASLTARSAVKDYMDKQDGEDRGNFMCLVIAMILHTWDCAKDGVKISTPPDKDRQDLVRKICTGIVTEDGAIKIPKPGETKTVVHEIRPSNLANLGETIGKIIGDKETGEQIAKKIKGTLDKRLGLGKKDDPKSKWDPHKQ